MNIHNTSYTSKKVITTNQLAWTNIMANFEHPPVSKGLVLRAFGLIFLLLVIRFFSKLYYNRMLVRRTAKKYGIVSPYESPKH
jgi:hypothetical protein